VNFFLYAGVSIERCCPKLCCLDMNLLILLCTLCFIDVSFLMIRNSCIGMFSWKDKARLCIVVPFSLGTIMHGFTFCSKDVHLDQKYTLDISWGQNFDNDISWGQMYPQSLIGWKVCPWYLLCSEVWHWCLIRSEISPRHLRG